MRGGVGWAGLGWAGLGGRVSPGAVGVAQSDVHGHECGHGGRTNTVLPSGNLENVGGDAGMGGKA